MRLKSICLLVVQPLASSQIIWLREQQTALDLGPALIKYTPGFGRGPFFVLKICEKSYVLFVTYLAV